MDLHQLQFQADLVMFLVSLLLTFFYSERNFGCLLFFQVLVPPLLKNQKSCFQVRDHLYLSAKQLNVGMNAASFHCGFFGCLGLVF